MITSCKSLGNIFFYRSTAKVENTQTIMFVCDTYSCMATRIYSVYTVRSSKNVPSAFTVSSVNLCCAHSLRVTAVPQLYIHKL